MSCYFRHMKDIFEEAGITVTPEKKRGLDRIFHEIAGTVYKDYPATWKELKKFFISNPGKRAELIKNLKAAAK